MSDTLTATYDGDVLHLDEPIELEPNTRVQITIENIEPLAKKSHSFLRTARSLNLQGPKDWSARFEDYLYRKEDERDD